MTRPVPAPPTELELAHVLHACADPVRLTIIAQLASSSEPIACGAFDVDVSKSTRSHHFRVLRESGVIATHRASGNRILNELRTDELQKAYPGLLDAILQGISAPEITG
ncbi:helix-turn-helix transcriptional regulator [Leucobacter viscericola]|uniref:Helix-turn-helix transcriptional regulator n=1 Tax=Leucobacter viscericola TaxID=2714935 RepID=A0A6G7XB65_9MICO|nr:helix-turn-helix transcriptional regulator [Leucobacter viscericola]QIK61805.1 helix-turn-helix transcriptional regulator [Leucobacter viscericola]